MFDDVVDLSYWMNYYLFEFVDDIIEVILGFLFLLDLFLDDLF